MITTLLIGSVSLNIIGGIIFYSLSKEKPTKKGKVIYKEKIVYRDKPVEKVIYKDKIVEKIIYKNKPVHEFIKKEEPKVSIQKQELLDALTELKSKKKKSKKDLDNIYTIEKVLPNIK
jgi:hypothetical protein